MNKTLKRALWVIHTGGYRKGQPVVWEGGDYVINITAFQDLVFSCGPQNLNGLKENKEEDGIQTWILPL